MAVVIPPWLVARFNAIYADAPHYEASYYGPVNMLLTSYFPATSGFMVKPQARLRQKPEPGGRESLDSYGQTVGTYDNDGNPDFLVSTGGPALHSDIPLLIYEVKREIEQPVNFSIQMDRYIEWAKDYQRKVAPTRPTKIVAVALNGSESWIYALHPTSHDIAVTITETTGNEALGVLQGIRDNN